MLGPDFQKVLTRNHDITTAKMAKTMWYAYLSSGLYFFLERLACARRALSLVSGSTTTSGVFSLGDLDLAILYYNFHNVDPNA